MIYVNRLKRYTIIFFINIILFFFYFKLLNYFVFTQSLQMNYLFMIVCMMPASIIGYFIEQEIRTFKAYIFLFLIDLIVYLFLNLLLNNFNYFSAFYYTLAFPSMIFVTVFTVYEYSKVNSILDIRYLIKKKYKKM